MDGDSAALVRLPEGADMATAHISHYGALIFSNAAVHGFRLPDAKSCNVFFDPGRNIVGIQLLSEQGESGRRVYTTPNSAHIMITSLMRAYGIALGADIECPVTADAHGEINLIAIDLTPAIHAAKMEPTKTVFPRRGATRPRRKKTSHRLDTNGRKS